MRSNFLALSSLLGALLAAAAAPAAQATPNSWEPARTWLFVVGTLEWAEAKSFGAFPQKHRRDAELVQHFRTAGVPPAQIVYLRDEAATRSRIDATMATHFRKARRGDLLVFYYCGHGYKNDTGRETYFACYDAGLPDIAPWSVPEIVAEIEHSFAGDQALLFADCCHSGSLAEIVARQKGRVALAALTSSSASESSTGNWTFTEAVLAALRGSAFTDLNRDGQITLAELAAFTRCDMALLEGQHSSFATTSDWAESFVLATPAPVRDPRLGERVEAFAQKAWWKGRIVDSRQTLQGPEYRVRYTGYFEEDDTWLAAKYLRAISIVRYVVGKHVEVRWEGKWWPAEILREENGVHFITYDGFGPAWNEWVSSKRIRGG